MHPFLSIDNSCRPPILPSHDQQPSSFIISMKSTSVVRSTKRMHVALSMIRNSRIIKSTSYGTESSTFSFHCPETFKSSTHKIPPTAEFWTERWLGLEHSSAIGTTHGSSHVLVLKSELPKNIFFCSSVNLMSPWNLLPNIPDPAGTGTAAIWDARRKKQKSWKLSLNILQKSNWNCRARGGFLVFNFLSDSKNTRNVDKIAEFISGAF